MAEQKKYLLDMAGRDNIDVRVLPFSVGPHLALKGAFNILEFDVEEMPTLIYQETYLGGGYESSQGVVDDLRQRWGSIYSMSVPIKEHLK
jgi:hypothetical protein